MKYNLLIAVGASLVGAVSVQGAEDWSEDFTGDVIVKKAEATVMVDIVAGSDYNIRADRPRRQERLALDVGEPFGGRLGLRVTTPFRASNQIALCYKIETNTPTAN